jgi:hypothetical protein
MRTSLAAASDCTDNAAWGNVENLETEVGKAIQTHSPETVTVCGLFQEDGGVYKQIRPGGPIPN